MSEAAMLSLLAQAKCALYNSKYKKGKKSHEKFRVQIFFGLLIITKGHSKQQKHWQLNKQQILYKLPNKKSSGVWNVLTSCF